MVLDCKNNKTKILKYCVVALHFVLTFFFERLFYRTTLMDILPPEIPISNAISEKAENILCYLISKLFCLIILYLFWTLIFAVFQKRIATKDVVLFGITFVGILLLQFILWKETFSAEVDNYITLGYSVRFLPYYWHHVFTGCVYSAVMMIFPNVFSIAFFQALAFVCTLGYIGITTGIRKPLLLFFILPYTLVVVTNPYRNCMYTILCMFYFAYLISGYLNKEKSQNNKRRIIFLLLSAFVAVWRTEGIFYGFFGCLTELIFVQDFAFVEKFKSYKGRFRRIISVCITLVIFGSVFYAVGFPQKIGNIRYYGSDYQFISMMPSLQTIFNADNSNLDYDGADEDIKAIEKVCPIKYIRAFGEDGFRCYNYQNGRVLVYDQSLASDETVSGFKRAYLNIIIHNPDLFLRTQLQLFLHSVSSRIKSTVYPPLQGQDGSFSRLILDLFQKDDIYISGFSLLEKPKIGFSIMQFIYKFLQNGFCRLLFSCLLIFIDFIIILLSLKKSIDNRHKRFFFTFIALILLTEFSVVILTMPEGRPAYFYPIFMSSAVVSIYYFREFFIKKYL